MDNSGEIYKKIPLIMGEVGIIEKGRKNKEQGYMFRGIDDVYAACHDALAKHGVFSVPNVLEVTREERQSKRGGTLIYTILKMQYTFYAKDGSFIYATTMGEAMDTGDKSANKAMSVAQKYAFLQIFAIPTEEPKDTENETHVLADRKSVAKKSKPATANTGGEITIDKRMLDYIAGVTNLPHLKNYWAQQTTQDELDVLSEKDHKRVVAAKDKKKAELTKELRKVELTKKLKDAKDAPVNEQDEIRQKRGQLAIKLGLKYSGDETLQLDYLESKGLSRNIADLSLDEINVALEELS